MGKLIVIAIAGFYGHGFFSGGSFPRLNIVVDNFVIDVERVIFLRFTFNISDASDLNKFIGSVGIEELEKVAFAADHAWSDYNGAGFAITYIYVENRN